MTTQELEARFWSKVDFDPHDIQRCWLWKDSTQRGYGNFHFYNTTGTRCIARAHRQAYIFYWGEIDLYFSSRIEIDHLCHDPLRCQSGDNCPHRRCCNPHHMQLSTTKNNSSAERMVYWQYRKTHCPSGHPYDHVNTQFRTNGHRVCGTCNRLRAARNRSVK